VSSNLGRNDPCHCGSGKKYKQCHLAADEAKEREARAKAVEQQPAAPVEEEAAPAPSRVPKHQTRQPWKKTATNTQGFGKTSLPRKVGGS
jgi:SEC-C motif